MREKHWVLCLSNESEERMCAIHRQSKSAILYCERTTLQLRVAHLAAVTRCLHFLFPPIVRPRGQIVSPLL